MADETTFILNARSGDHRSFRKLYDAHVEPLYRFLRQFSKHHHEVEEWVQRAFIKAFERLDTFDGRARFSTWLFTIALNEMRSDQRRRSILPLETLEHHSSGPHDDIDKLDWDLSMKTILETLDETKRAVFILHEVEGFSHAEIALMLELQESSSRAILSRTKQWLRKQWELERKAAG